VFGNVGYKGALQVFLGRRVHLVWNDGEIDWETARKTLWPEEHPNENEKRMYAELRMIRKKITPVEEQITGIIMQYAAVPLIQYVHEALKLLTERDKQIVFMAYINHDWEPPIGNLRYRTLSNREIARRMGCDDKTVAHAKRRAVNIILENTTYS